MRCLLCLLQEVDPPGTDKPADKETSEQQQSSDDACECIGMHALFNATCWSDCGRTQTCHRRVT
jgi:hypothetical protein